MLHKLCRCEASRSTHGLVSAEYLYLKQAGIACLVYDAVTCGRSEMDPAKRSWVRDMMWLPNDVEAFYQVRPIQGLVAASNGPG